MFVCPLGSVSRELLPPALLFFFVCFISFCLSLYFPLVFSALLAFILYQFFSSILVFPFLFFCSLSLPLCLHLPLISLSFSSFVHLLPCLFTPTLFPAVISVFLSFVRSDLLLSELSTWWADRDTDTHGGTHILHIGTQSSVQTLKIWAQRRFTTIYTHTQIQKHCHTVCLYQEEGCFQDESLYTVNTVTFASM